jgi:hypothetical protein
MTSLKMGGVSFCFLGLGRSILGGGGVFMEFKFCWTMAMEIPLFF